MSGFELSETLKMFWQFSWLQWVLFSLAVNIFLYLLSIGLYWFIDKTCRKEKLQLQDHPVTRSDVYLSFLTIGCNSFVMILGVLLWKHGLIILNQNQSIIVVIAEVIALLLLMDFMMYIFHYAAHIPFCIQDFCTENIMSIQAPIFLVSSYYILWKLLDLE